MGTFEKLGENVLPHRHQKHDHEGKENPCDGNPRYPEAYEQVRGLEEGEGSDRLERYAFHEGRVVVLEHSVRSNPMVEQAIQSAIELLQTSELTCIFCLVQ